MRGRLLGLLLVAAVSFPATAAAAPVLVMSRTGRVHRANDRFLPAAAPAPAPASSPRPAARRPRLAASAARAKAKPKPKLPTVTSELTRLYRAGQITESAYTSYSGSWSAATAAAKHLHGTRAVELGAVIKNVTAMAAAHDFIPSRLPAIFLTLDRNRQWWTSGPIPYSGQEMEFTNSNLVWEYYPGQGLELQVLATFGKADGLYTGGPSDYPQLRALLNEMIPLAVQRAGGIAWEYYFRWEGGAPPWTSAMAQGTGIEALTRAAKAFGPLSGPSGSSESYLQIAQQALALFTVAPPTGVRVATARGARYLQYSFAPNTDIINAFLQSLIGLYDYAQESKNAEAKQLFAAGNAEAEAEVPEFDTGAWSLYQPGIEDDLNYHELVTGFLQQMCSRTRASVYCTTAQHFETYMKTPPVLRLLTTQATSKRRFSLRFWLSKYSHVGIVITRGTQSVLRTSAYFPYQGHSVTVPALKPGTYQVVLAATDLPGNFTRLVGTLHVSPPRRST
ncbi:MAG TPA: D-glucuronyl C5-epimerase family protein [Solirubrobacteraceae bacterium]|nr:D-glucuronyl C5-epimerase family protein [Solirubrobacteraceae bacterium]